MEGQREVFYNILKASIRNIIFFVLATAAIAHLASIKSLRSLALLFGVLETLIIFTTLGALIYFVQYTIKTYSQTRMSQFGHSFMQVYGYTIAAFIFRLLEVAVYIYILIFLYNLFLK
ncbi:hypothetical protein [Thermosyntropha sp.]|uniref:hypothetical protein n=1 Tax=Thermosyntropha sp. TaxID=2740820 RepID=UPI0025DFB236|nr:hypothetical protein [Thermosyntropha sp.]MBO8159272.1 hypothetical protein [Thermosyntropha sp.]